MDTIMKIESNEKYEEVLKGMINCLHFSGNENVLNLDNEVKEAKQELITVISSCNYDLKAVTEMFLDRNWDQQRVEYLVNLIVKKKTELLYASLTYHNSKFGENVTNFDWYLKLVFGSSHLNSLKYPLLQLIFYTINNKCEQNTLLYDVDKDVLHQLIQVLERIDE